MYNICTYITTYLLGLHASVRISVEENNNSISFAVTIREPFAVFWCTKLLDGVPVFHYSIIVSVMFLHMYRKIVSACTFIT